MPLEKRNVSIPLTDNGLADSADPFASDPPGFETLQDARWTRDKQLAKRWGMTDDTANLTPAGVGLPADPNNFVDLDGATHILTGDLGTLRRDPVTKQWRAMNDGTPRMARCVTDPVVRGVYSSYRSDSAIAGTIVCVTWSSINTDGSSNGAWYQFFDVSSDTPRPTSPPTKLATSVTLTRVTSLGGRYFLLTGQDAATNLYIATYDSAGTSWTFGIEVLVEQVQDLQYALNQSYDGTSFVLLAYVAKGSGSVTVRKYDQVGTLTAVKTLTTADPDVQWVMHNGPLSLAMVISKNGKITKLSDLLNGADTSFQPFVNPPSGKFTGKFARASIGLASFNGAIDGTMWAARSTAAPIDTTKTQTVARGAQPPIGSQMVYVTTAFAAIRSSTYGGIVLASHFSPVITSLGTSLVSFATQAAINPSLARPVTRGTTPPVAQTQTTYNGATSLTTDPTTALYGLRPAPVARLVRPFIGVHYGAGFDIGLATAGRFGQDAIDLMGSPSSKFDTAASHLPRLATDPTTNGARVVSAYPVRISSDFGGEYSDGFLGAGTLPDYPLLNAVQRGIDLAQALVLKSPVAHTSSAQGLALVASGAGASSIDGTTHAELTPAAPEWVIVDGSEGGYPSLPSVLSTTQMLYHLFGIAFSDPGVPALGSNLIYDYVLWYVCIVWQWIDAKGALHRSPPSSPAPMTGFQLFPGYPSQIVTTRPKLCFPPLLPTSQLGDLGIVPQAAIYAAPVFGDNSPLTISGAAALSPSGQFRLIGTCVPAPDPVDESRVFVTLGIGDKGLHVVDLVRWDSLATYSYPGTGSQTPLSGGPAAPALYTDPAAGSQLPSAPTPSVLAMVTTLGRMWALSGENRLDVWYTKPMAQGIAPEFSDSLRVRVPQEGGPVTGIAALDDKLVIFKKTRIYVVVGDPGDAAGNGSTLQPPRLISSDVGCDSVESVAEGPFGVVFHGPRGFHTLSRGLEIAFTGDKVLAQLDGSINGVVRSVVSSCVVPNDSEVRFICDNATGSNPIELVWNYRFGRWCRRDSQGCSFSSTINGAEVGWNQTLTKVLRETPLAWAAYGTGLPSWPLLTWTTSWIKMDGIAGYGRVWRCVLVLRWYDGGITVQTAQDYLPATESVKTWTAAQLAALADPTTHLLELDIRPKVQACEAIRLIVSETQAIHDGSGRGFELVGVNVEVGIKPGAFQRLPSTARQ